MSHETITSYTPIWAVGVPNNGSLGWGHFSAIIINVKGHGKEHLLLTGV